MRKRNNATIRTPHNQSNTMRQYLALLLALILATALPPALAADSNTPTRAESSDAAAQFRQAQSLALSDSPDIPAAMRWYEKAAQQGHAKAQTALGILYLNQSRHSASEELAQGQRWLEQAAAQHEAAAESILGTYEAMIKENIAAAKRHWENAAARGDSDAMQWLALLYLDGDSGVPQDQAKALAWWQKASNAGNAEAAYRLAEACIDGRYGLPKDLQQGFRYMKQAAEGGNAVAALRLSQMYQAGSGTHADPVQAAQWLNRYQAWDTDRYYSLKQLLRKLEN